ncbi:MAG: hypothetical protein AB7L13_18205 [Acidimicrobiia bacterium]
MAESNGAVIMWRAPFEPAARTERIVQAYHVLVSFLRDDVRLVAVGADLDKAYRARLQEEVNELNLTASRFASEGEELPTATITLTPSDIPEGVGPTALAEALHALLADRENR